jgi:hypothetical protein
MSRRRDHCTRDPQVAVETGVTDGKLGIKLSFKRNPAKT